MSKKIYISASTQSANVGVGKYGTEQSEMMSLADLVKYYLEAQDGKFIVFRNRPGWDLNQTIKDVIAKSPDLAIDNHSNAGDPKTGGTEDFFHTGDTDSQAFAKVLYDAIAPLSPGKDRGVLMDTTLYKSGLGFLRCTTNVPVKVLIEHVFHTNIVEVQDMMTRKKLYARAEAQAICKWYGYTFIDPDSEKSEVPGKPIGKGEATKPVDTPKPVETLPFKDIAGHWAKDFIVAAKELGIMTGNGDGTFNPDGPFTRAQAAVVSVKLYELTTGKKVMKG